MQDWGVFLISQAILAAVQYAAIRADLREALTRAKSAEDSATEAHRRLDDFLIKGRLK